MNSKFDSLATLLFSMPLAMSLIGCSGHDKTKRAVSISAPSSNAIIDGRLVQKSDEVWKSVVQLNLIDSKGIRFDVCSGTLITDNIVLTAAHCLSNPRTARIQLAFSQGVDTQETLAIAGHSAPAMLPTRWAKASVAHPEFTGGRTIWKTYSSDGVDTESEHRSEGNAGAKGDIQSIDDSSLEDFPPPEQDAVNTARAQLSKTHANGPDFAFDLFSYDTQGSHDLGLIVLDQAVEPPYKPLAILDDPSLAWSPNTVLHAGYGLSRRILDMSDTGVLRTSEASILGWTSNRLVMETYTDTADHAACSGDSGGPALVRVGNGYQIAGVISVSDCWSMTSDILLMKHREWIRDSLEAVF